MSESLEKGKITSVQQGSLLVLTFVISTAILFVPGITAETAGPDGWISILFVTTFHGIFIALIIGALSKRFPGKTLVQYNEDILGKFLGKILNLLYIFWFIYAGATITREFSDFLLSTFMAQTPVVVFIGTLVIVSASLVRNGIEVLARANIFVFPILFLSFLLIVGLEAKDIKIENLLPIMENGFLPVLAGSLVPMGFTGEIIVVAMFIPYLNQPEKATFINIISVILIGIILTLDNLITTAVLGVELTANQIFPVFNLARYIEVGGFLERVEALIMLMWVTGIVIKVSVFYYVAVLASAQTFNLKDFKPIVFPVGLLMITWSITFYENILEVAEHITKIFPPYAFIMELLIPLALLLVALVRKKGGKAKNAKENNP